MDSFYKQDELRELGLKKIGTNVLISRKASIYGASNISIGNNVRIDDFCILSGKICISNYVHISAYTGLYGGSKGIVLESFTGISSRCVVYAESDDYLGESMTNPMLPDKFRNVYGEGVSIRRHALIGSGCTILPSVIIGEGASVGAMSLVNKNIDPWTVNIGIPCKKIKNRSQNILKLEHEFLNGK